VDEDERAVKYGMLVPVRIQVSTGGPRLTDTSPPASVVRRIRRRRTRYLSAERRDVSPQITTIR
jgi:hypothetical protein